MLIFFDCQDKAAFFILANYLFPEVLIKGKIKVFNHRLHRLKSKAKASFQRTKRTTRTILRQGQKLQALIFCSFLFVLFVEEIVFSPLLKVRLTACGCATDVQLIR